MNRRAFVDINCGDPRHHTVAAATANDSAGSMAAETPAAIALLRQACELLSGEAA